MDSKRSVSPSGPNPSGPGAPPASATPNSNPSSSSVSPTPSGGGGAGGGPASKKDTKDLASPLIGNETVMMVPGSRPMTVSAANPTPAMRPSHYPVGGMPTRPAAQNLGGAHGTVQYSRPPVQAQFTQPPRNPLLVLNPAPIYLPPKPDSRLVLLTDPDSARAASFRLLRDNLLTKRLPRVLAITSAVKKDGKTTCALNLALSLSEGARVLLLEGNLIDPALAEIVCIDEGVPALPNAPFFNQYRVGELSPSLHVAAPPANLAPPRFDKPWFESMIAQLRRFNYNFVIIDAAAVDASPNVSQILAAADATLVAVKSGVTTARALRRASEQIPPGRAMGVALIDAKPNSV